MTKKTLNFSNYAVSLGLTLLLHLLVFIFSQPPGSLTSIFIKEDGRGILAKSYSIKWVKPLQQFDKKVKYDPAKVSAKKTAHKQGLAGNTGKKLSLTDLKVPNQKILVPTKSAFDQQLRPGKMPKAENALTKVRFGNEELKQMAKEAFSGNANVLAGDKISLKYEVPNGKNLDELNDVELRLYGFLKRGAKNYATSIATELHEFSFKYPHVNFPVPDTKQIMTGKLTYDEKGNLKQIKMIRWTNIDKLQLFFENVLKRMEVMQNPPKELWARNGEFTVFVTLQVND